MARQYCFRRTFQRIIGFLDTIRAALSTFSRPAAMRSILESLICRKYVVYGDFNVFHGSEGHKQWSGWKSLRWLNCEPCTFSMPGGGRFSKFDRLAERPRKSRSCACGNNPRAPRLNAIYQEIRSFNCSGAESGATTRMPWRRKL